ncbi:hypothetical protein BT96DRAFT_470109 [Gymnopus androsaceus JB14]|uniref:Uncharacterized protein n=1 Tax=Gymnopus androsaceus JB14 TaxID=1447944 RepID=A0A6A4IMW6_9AGAR|nr:hypothetical protein BT96DRAFT_470109 [Gymnopus androsaceus JB14]
MLLSLRRAAFPNTRDQWKNFAILNNSLHFSGFLLRQWPDFRTFYLPFQRYLRYMFCCHYDAQKGLSSDPISSRKYTTLVS